MSIVTEDLQALLEQARANALQKQQEKDVAGGDDPWREDEIILTSEKEKEDER